MKYARSLGAVHTCLTNEKTLVSISCLDNIKMTAKQGLV